MKGLRWTSILLLVVFLASTSPSASVQLPLAVVSISPAPGATDVDPETSVVVTFNYPLIPQSVTPSTFLVQRIEGIIPIPVVGIITVFGSVATFRPLTPLAELTTYRIVLKGGTGGILGSNEQFMPSDFVSTFRTGRKSGGTPVDFTQGATVTDPQTGASTEIPPYTLKEDATISIVVDPSDLGSSGEENRRLESLRYSGSLPSGDSFPSVEGMVRVTRVVRFEVDPPGLTAFGPGMKISLPLLSEHVGRLPQGTTLRLFQLALRSDGREEEPVFVDTGIPAVVSTRGIFGPTVAISPDVQTFGTYAAFQEISAQGVNLSAAPVRQDQGSQLIFPIVEQSGERASRLSLANMNVAEPTTVELHAYTPTGDLYRTVSRMIPAGQAAAFLVSDLFPGFSTGAIIARAEAGPIHGQIEIADDFSRPGVLAAGDAVTTVPSALVFPVIATSSGRFTEIHLFNPFDEPVSVIIKAFDRERKPVTLTNSAGESLTVVKIPPHGKVVAACSGSGCERRTQAQDVVIPLDRLDGGYVLAFGDDPSKGVVGAELFGETTGGRRTLTMVASGPLPRGCVIRGVTATGCRVSEDPLDPAFVPDVARQHTLYAPHFEDSPATAEIVLVNVSDVTVPAAFTAFREDGSFRASYPASGFFLLEPHQVVRLPVQTLLGFNPAPGYVRVEDPLSALVGALINQRTTSPPYLSAIPLIADDPQIAQSPSVLFLSRIQLDPTATIPRLTTGLVVFNPGNNANPFAAIVRSGDGRTNRVDQSVTKRGVLTRWRGSLSVAYPTVREGILEIRSTKPETAGETRRLIVVGIYRATIQSGSSFALSTAVIAH
ncbi:MAG TPA: Ig-like domain-containing protein [Blastocatellia bacterium]|nr:Ig-like domain-containing protein [Blastocatellia bacterium]